ncbi:MAG: chemotaxis protein CheX [Rhodospirillales bacterium]|nr:chemotaxis protein CheX [Rhodospirillales bacterium]
MTSISGAEYIPLTELERDALTELVNVGVSRAAAGLRKMVGEEVLLSVPSVEVVSHKSAIALIGERESDDLIAVRQDFSGAFAGRALLIFPRAKSLDLVRAVIGDDIAADELAGIEHEALSEIGNVILTSCLSTMANMLRDSFTMSLPEVLLGNGAQLFEVTVPGENNLVLFLYINFSMHNRDIRGYIAMLMDVPSLDSVKVLIGEFITGVMDDPA